MKRLKYFFKGDTDKEYRLNQILDKISKKETIFNFEQKFLDNYNLEYIKDYLFLSKNDFLIKLNYLLYKKDIICNLQTHNNKVIHIINKEDKDFLLLENNIKCEVKDNYLYHINYVYKNDHFKLTESDEFYEKIEKDDN
jgi:hypothetical protein